MAAIIRNSFRVYNAKKFISSLNAVNGSYTNTLYMGIGRPQPWSLTNDTPATPANNIKDELTDWSDVMFMKRLFSPNICHAVQKRMWAPNTQYDNYRHDWNGYATAPELNTRVSEILNSADTPPDLSQVQCYCTSPLSNRTYLCLQHGVDAVGTITYSTVNPDNGSTTVPGVATTSSVYSNIIYTSDGYVWLKLADSTDLLAQFETIDYYPVMTTDGSHTSDAGISQNTLQANASNHKGGVYSIIVTARGSGYNSNNSASFHVTDPTTSAHVRVYGDGTGLEYVVSYASGKLNKIVVTNPGSGYTWAKVVVSEPSGTSAIADPILTPMYGIGVDPVKTLNAFNIIIQASIYDDENTTANAIDHGADFTVDNDYRKLLLVANPESSVGNLAQAIKLDMTYALTNSTSGSADVAPDTILTNGSCRVRVVDSGTTSFGRPIIRVVQTELDASTTSANTNVVEGTFTYPTGTFTTSSAPNGVIEPDAIVGSGDIIYADYRRPITRAKQQSEEFKIVLEF